MEKITFVDNVTKANADTFNTMQDNIEDAIEEKQTYSTGEQVIGTWVDGKPIYRKVFTTTGDNNNSQTLFTQNNIDNIVNFSGWVKNGNTIRWLNTCFYGGLNWASQFYYSNGNDGVIECGNDMKSFKNGAKIYVIIEYTKTTD